jgi:hypothetical protein
LVVAYIDPVVVVEAAANPEMIPRLECGAVDLPCQVLKHATTGGAETGVVPAPTVRPP